MGKKKQQERPSGGAEPAGCCADPGCAAACAKTDAHAPAEAGAAPLGDSTGVLCSCVAPRGAPRHALCVRGRARTRTCSTWSDGPKCDATSCVAACACLRNGCACLCSRSQALGCWTPSFSRGAAYQPARSRSWTRSLTRMCSNSASVLLTCVRACWLLHANTCERTNARPLPHARTRTHTSLLHPFCAGTADSMDTRIKRDLARRPAHLAQETDPHVTRMDVRVVTLAAGLRSAFLLHIWPNVANRRSRISHL